MRVSIGLLFVAMSWPCLPAQAQSWGATSTEHGIRIQARALAGERFEQLRLTAELEQSPQVVSDYLFGRYLDERNRNITRTFLSRDVHKVVWSDVLRVPLMGSRCYAMQFERVRASGGEVVIDFRTLPAPQPAGVKRCIPLRARGHWSLAPSGSGTRLTYLSLTDVGGSVPTGLVNRSLKDAAVASVRKVAAGAAGQALPHGIGD